MADIISLIQEEMLDDTDEGVFDQGDGPSTAAVDDESLPPLLRVQKYALSDKFFDRQMVPRVLVEIFKTCSPDAIAEDLSQMMDQVAKLAEQDDVMVRTELIKQIPSIAATAAECTPQVPCLGSVLPSHLLPLIVHNLSTPDNQVRKTTHTALFSLLEQGLISRIQAEVQICPTVLALSQMENLMDYTGAVTLMSKMTAYLGREVTERVFLKRFSQLCSNSMFCVRKVCASHFGDFCAVVSQTAFRDTLLPCYISMCSDDIWGVRRACAEVVMSVSCACTPDIRRSVLAPVFVKLLQDESRWVRLAAFQALGPFISTFADSAVTGLSYNQLGELVLVKPDSAEISANSFSRESSALPEPNFSIYSIDDILELDITHNPLSMEESDPFRSGTSGQSKEIDKENQSMLGLNTTTIAEDISLNEGEKGAGDDLDDFIPNLGDQVDIKEIVETVKNAVLIFRNNSSLVVENLNKICDDPDEKVLSFTEKLTSITLKSPETPRVKLEPFSTTLNKTAIVNSSVKSSAVVSSNCNIEDNVSRTSCAEKKGSEGDEEDNLEEFNCYNYWYIKPELPVDPGIAGDTAAVPNVKPDSTIKVEVMQSADNTRDNLSLDSLKNSVAQEEKSTSAQALLSPGQILVQTIKVSEDKNLDVVPKFLIDFFVSMTDPNLAQFIDSELAYHCAYSLPAVALTLGSKNWNLLRGTVELLAADMQYKVRRTVASSLHELATILGPEIATASLAPIFEGFIKDLDEVRIGILRHLAHFLKLIHPPKRMKYLPRLAEFLQTDNETNWRFRQELAEQLLLAIPLFRPVDASKHIASLAQELLCDKVAAVREVALLLITELLRYISADQSMTSCLLIKLAEKFAHSKKWKRRQSFALLCSQILASQAISLEQFSFEAMPHLLDLSWDPVANVRIVVARTLSAHIVTQNYFMDSSNQHFDSLQTVLRRLQADKDRDVRYSATNSPTSK